MHGGRGWGQEREAGGSCQRHREHRRRGGVGRWLPGLLRRGSGGIGCTVEDLLAKGVGLWKFTQPATDCISTPNCVSRSDCWLRKPCGTHASAAAGPAVAPLGRARGGAASLCDVTAPLRATTSGQRLPLVGHRSNREGSPWTSRRSRGRREGGCRLSVTREDRTPPHAATAHFTCEAGRAAAVWLARAGRPPPPGTVGGGMRRPGRRGTSAVASRGREVGGGGEGSAPPGKLPSFSGEAGGGHAFRAQWWLCTTRVPVPVPVPAAR